MNLRVAEYEKVTGARLSHINVGTGVNFSIAELASLISEVTGFTGNINFDTSKPDGSPRKLMDNTKLKSLGWQPEFSLKEGLVSTYQWLIENYEKVNKQDSKTNE